MEKNSWEEQYCALLHPEELRGAGRGGGRLRASARRCGSRAGFAESPRQSHTHRALSVPEGSVLRLNALHLSLSPTSDTELMKPVCLFTLPLIFHLLFTMFPLSINRLSFKGQDGTRQQQFIKEEKEAASILSCHLFVKQRLSILNNFLLLELKLNPISFLDRDVMAIVE